MQLICTKCKELKNMDEFSINNKNTRRFFRHGYCKLCDNQARKIRDKKRQESKNETSTEDQERNMTYREIGERIGCSNNVVIACERRAFDKLKTVLIQRGIYSASDFI